MQEKADTEKREAGSSVCERERWRDAVAAYERGEEQTSDKKKLPLLFLNEKSGASPQIRMSCTGLKQQTHRRSVSCSIVFTHGTFSMYPFTTLLYLSHAPLHDTPPRHPHTFSMYQYPSTIPLYLIHLPPHDTLVHFRCTPSPHSYSFCQCTSLQTPSYLFHVALHDTLDVVRPLRVPRR